MITRFFKYHFIHLSLIFLLTCSTFFTHHLRAQIGWQKKPFSERDFCKNIDRYKNLEGRIVLYFYQENNLKYFITNKGISITQTSLNIREDLHEHFKHIKNQDSTCKPIEDIIHLDFNNANFDSIVTIDKLPYTRNHQSLLNQNQTIMAPCYTSIEVKSIYDKIDLIIEIAAGGGIKYSFRIFPGGDPNMIQINSNASISELNDDLIFKNKTIQHYDLNLMAYQNINKEIKKIQIENEIIQNQIKYKLGDYQQDEILYIDPWLVSSLSFTSDTKGYEIGTDNNGNVFLLGQTGGEIAGYDNNGNLLWVWTSPNGFIIYGDMVTNSQNGDTYFIYSVPSVTFDVFRLNASGVVISTFDLATVPGTPTETWRLYFDEVNQELILGGGGVTGTDPVICKFNADLSIIQIFPTLPYSNFEVKDVTLLCSDKSGTNIYFLISKAFFSDYDNFLFKSEFANPDNIIWDEFADYNFNEAQSVLYCGLPGLFSPNGYNGITTDYSGNVYTYDGNELKKWDDVFGIPIDSVSINKIPFAHGGIDVDLCDNIYIGTNDSIIIFDNQLNYQGGYALPDSCYDIKINNFNLVATGKNFVASFEILNDIFDLNIYATADVCAANIGIAIIDTISCPNFMVQSINWTPGNFSTPEITDLSSGWYTATVTWAHINGQTFTMIDSVFVDQTSSLLTSTSIQDASCDNSCNGEIIINTLAGTAPYSFNLNGVNNSTGIYSNLCSGWYPYSVVDFLGCNFFDTVFVANENSLEVQVQNINSPTCNGFNDGSITVTTNGTSGTISYVWTPTNAAGGNTFNNLTAGNYSVVAIDSDGCSDTMFIVLSQPDSLMAFFNFVEPFCHGENSGAILIDTIIGYQGNYFLNSLTLLPENITINPDENFENIFAGNYIINVADSAGCSNTYNLNLTQPDSLYFTELGFNSAFCRSFGYQSGGGVVFAAAGGGTSGYDYLWINQETLDSSNNTTWGGLNPGNYLITVFDANGCLLQEIIELDSLNPTADFEIISNQLNTNLEGTEIVFATFENNSINFSNTYDPNADTIFFWNLNFPYTNWQYTDDYYFQPDSNYIGEAIYEICLVAINHLGCSDTLCKLINVHDLPIFNPPNIFTPGQNSVNDLFNFIENSEGIESIKCVIVNRWGNEIITLYSINDSWDGNDKNGNLCADGVYFYTYQITFTNGTFLEGQSSLQLIRD